MNKTNLIRIHHAGYLEDIPFWIFWTDENKSVLEVGCGHGRVSLPLLAAGRKVVGVDIDLPALQYLRGELEQKELELQNRAQIVHEDIISYQAEGLFGSVIIPCNTYSTFPTEERLMILSKAFRNLCPGGIFAASVPNPTQVKYFYEDTLENPDQVDSDLESFFPHPDTGYPVQVSSRLIANDESLGWDWIYDHLHPDGQVDRFIQSTKHYLTAVETYLHEFSEAGLKGIRILGDFDQKEYSEDSPYLILVGEKPDY